MTPLQARTAVFALSFTALLACDGGKQAPAASEAAEPAKPATPAPAQVDDPAAPAPAEPEPEPEPASEPASEPAQAQEFASLTPMKSPATQGNFTRLELSGGDNPVMVTLIPLNDDDDSWLAVFTSTPDGGSQKLVTRELDQLCDGGSSDYGIFSSIGAPVASGYSSELRSNVVVLEASHTFDDTGNFETGVAVLFWRRGRPMCWTRHNSDYKDRVATGLFKD